MSTPGEPVPQRIGDAERDRAVELLKEHLAQGRIDGAEFDERLGAALAAKTAGDLDPLFDDLPGPRPGQAVSTTSATLPLSASQTGLSPTGSSQAAAPPGRKGSTAVVVASAIAWPLTLLLLFATDWRSWWLLLIPIMISSIAGKIRQHGPDDRPPEDRGGTGS